ncbi:MAG TPA: NAD(P)-dependent alcohol dehydrogenase, partial [bacterium]|nr:NAD(P)-dependent alcohol dehydrogenase [bacterium]
RFFQKPALRAGQVLVEVKGAAFNPADLKVISGKDGGPFLHAAQFPIQLGFDYAGVVAEVGAGETELLAGQAVYGFLAYSPKTTQGSFASYVAVSPEELYLKPQQLDFASAASLATAGVTALRALRDKGRLQAGQSVLINGAAGGVGSLAVQIAKILGARVTATAGGKNLDFVRSLGADQALDYRATPLGEYPGPFDIFLDAASASSFGAAAPLLKPGGIYVTLLPKPSLLVGWLASLFSSKACRFVITASQKADLALLAEWVEAGKLKATVEKTFRFEEVPAGLEELKKASPRGKFAVSF